MISAEWIQLYPSTTSRSRYIPRISTSCWVDRRHLQTCGPESKTRCGERQRNEYNWKPALNAQGRIAPMAESGSLQSCQGNQRFASGRRTGKSFSDFTEPSDSSKTIPKRTKEMEYLLRTIFVLVIDRVGNLVDLRSERTTNVFLFYKEFRLQEMAIAL